MKKLIKFMLITVLTILPTSVFASDNAAKIGTTEYATLESAVAAATNGDTIELLKNTSGTDLVLSSGITLVVPENITLSLGGNTIAKSGSVVNINGIILITDGRLDASNIESTETTGLILGQDGKVSINEGGQLILPTVWHAKWESSVGLWQPNGTYATHIFGTIEDGASLVINNNNYVYDTDTWKGAFNVGTTDYETFAEALAAIPTTGGTIKLNSDVIIPYNTEIIGKKVTIDLNGHNLSAIQKVFLINNSTVDIIGTGKVINIINYDVAKSGTPSNSVIELRGSTTETDTDYTNLYIGPNVTLEARVGIYIQYTILGTGKYAYGVNLEVDGKINAVDDKQSGTVYTGVGIQINGLIAHATNRPIITLNEGSKITSTGVGIFAAGNTTLVVNSTVINSVESGVAIKAGSLTLNNAKITVTGEDTSPTEGFSNGVNSSGAVIQIESNNSYAGDIGVTINGGTYTSENGVVIYEYLDSATTETKVSSINVNSGTFIAGTGKNVFKISNELTDLGLKYVSGGTFSSNPANYLNAGYKAVVNASGNYVVSKIVVETGTKTISGTITDGANATVQLKQGSAVLKTVVASETGAYSFTGVAKGTYNIAFIVGDISTMATVTVADENITLSITMPESGSVLVETKGTSTPDVIVEGLEIVAPGQDVELVIEVTTRDTDDIEQNKIIEETDDKEVLFLDLSLLINNDEISELEEGVLHLIVPFDMSSRKDFDLYRYHDRVVQKFTKLTALPDEEYEDQTYYVDAENGNIHIFTSQFSTYAIAYTEENPETFDATQLYIIVGLFAILLASASIYKIKKYN